MNWNRPFIPRKWSLFILINISDETEISNCEFSYGKPVAYTRFEYINRLTGRVHQRIISGHNAQYYREVAEEYRT